MSSTIKTDIARVVLFALSWVNSILVSTGHKTLPVIDETQVYWVITLLVSIWAMVKDNPFKSFLSKPASEAPVVPPAAPSIDASKVSVAPAASAEPVPSSPVEAVEQPAQPNAPAAPVEAAQPAVDPASEAPKEP